MKTNLYCVFPEAYSFANRAMTLETTYKRKVPYRMLVGFSIDWHYDFA